MGDILHIALVQSNLHWNNPVANRDYFNGLLKEVENVDLIVLPEMFTTAFCMEGKAEKMEGESVQWMLQLAKKIGAAVCGSLIILENDERYNRFVWVTPEGNIEYYDKRHLFSLMGEDRQFSAGSERKIIRYKGWSICPQICYDLRFPVFSRNNCGYDLLLYVANWPVRRITAWDKLLQARAIENQSYVVGVNRVGTDINDVSFVGHSATYDFFGQSLAFLGERERVEVVTLDREKLEEVRKRLPFLQDGDDFTVSS